MLSGFGLFALTVVLTNLTGRYRLALTILTITRGDEFAFWANEQGVLIPPPRVFSIVPDDTSNFHLFWYFFL